ncbi:MAG: DNA repair protein RecN [Paludibacteraceae bacterium]
MLKSLYISNYALITELNIGFESGMSVLTGETGAGKSIIIGALSLIQGQRADTRVVKEGTEKSVVEAGFEIRNYSLQSFFDENDLDYSELCVIRREISINGKSRAFVNDTPVSLNMLRELSDKLLDIHSQHENLLLSTENYQLQVVDSVAQNKPELTAYLESFNNWNKAKADLQKLRKEADRRNADRDYLQFQLNQLNDAKLAEGEQTELEAEFEMLNHVEEIKSELQQADYHFANEEMNVLKSIREIALSVQKIKNYLPESENWADRLGGILIDLKDIASDISIAQEKLDFNPERLEFLDNRLNLIYTLQKKFKVDSVKELIELRESLRTQLNRIENFEDELREAETLVEKCLTELKIKSSILTESRERAKPVIEKYLIEQLLHLGMPNIQFVVSIKSGNEFTDKGKDVVVFLFSANKNRSVQPVAEIASGGEISRLMLGIKSLLVSKSDLPTIIFDEIDTGISGEISGRMGEIMKKMSESTQVIVITHLPQIAAKGHVHYNVYKDNSGKQTETHIHQLTPAERIQEIASMLSGKTVTEAALMNAKELLK